MEIITRLYTHRSLHIKKKKKTTLSRLTQIYLKKKKRKQIELTITFSSQNFFGTPYTRHAIKPTRVALLGRCTFRPLAPEILPHCG